MGGGAIIASQLNNDLNSTVAIWYTKAVCQGFVPSISGNTTSQTGENWFAVEYNHNNPLLSR